MAYTQRPARPFGPELGLFRVTVVGMGVVAAWGAWWTFDPVKDISFFSCWLVSFFD